MVMLKLDAEAEKLSVVIEPWWTRLLLPMGTVDN
jgi:hypothetical protein